MAGRRRSERALRHKLRSPGRPPGSRREHMRHFWTLIAIGLTSEDAAIGAGVSQPVGALVPAGRRYATIQVCSFGEVTVGALSVVRRAVEPRGSACTRSWVREIGRRLRRSGSTVSRELRRNAATRSGGLDYRATTAQWHAERAAHRPKSAKLAVHVVLSVLSALAPALSR